MDQQMSYFLPPITNTLPTGNCTLREVYRWITEDKSLETVTNELRAFIREGRVAEYRQLKQRQLPFVTPHGVFSRRKSDALISASGLVVVDIDHLFSKSADLLLLELDEVAELLAGHAEHRVVVALIHNELGAELVPCPLFKFL